MDYRRLGNHVVCRLERGEEIHTQLKIIAQQENIRLAQVFALGAVDDFTLGCYNVGEKQYHKNHFCFPAEITMLYGNITTKNGEYYAHLHMTVADEAGHAFGGHLNEAIIAATCELFIQVIDGRVDRTEDEALGLNLLAFD